MYKLEVTSDKLNVRNTPEADSTFANWIGDLNKGEQFTAIKLVKGISFEGNDNWYVDNFNRYLWEGAATQWWCKLLNIPALQELAMDLINEQNQINIAVLDTGIVADDAVQKSFNIIGKRNFVNDNDDVIDTIDGHGTLCASLICANHSSFKGINPKANLFIGKIFDDDGITSGGIITKAINYILDPDNNLNIDIISISGGTDDAFNAEGVDALKKAVDRSIILSCAIGNVGQTQTGRYPALYRTTLSIGALSEQNTFADINPQSFSRIDFCLPGEDIHGLNFLQMTSDFNGTSQACAIMSGVISLIFAKAKSNNLSWKLNDVKNFFSMSSDEFDVPVNSGSVKINKLNSEKLIDNFKRV